MAVQYFFTHDETQHGPYSALEMQGLAAAGKIEQTDPVWRQGIGKPIPAGRVNLLFQSPESQPVAHETDAAPTALSEAAPDDEATAEPVAASAFTPAQEQTPRRTAEKDRPRRVVSITGGVLGAQDGRQVNFRKKCDTCGYEDQCRTTAIIRPGSMKFPFFCRKCRKGRVTQMMGIS